MAVAMAGAAPNKFNQYDELNLTNSNQKKGSVMKLSAGSFVLMDSFDDKECLANGKEGIDAQG